jgi:hypothetical protein
VDTGAYSLHQSLHAAEQAVPEGLRNFQDHDGLRPDGIVQVWSTLAWVNYHLLGPGSITPEQVNKDIEHFGYADLPVLPEDALEGPSTIPRPGRNYCVSPLGS